MIRSHKGITGNEIADKAASLAYKIIPRPTTSDLPTNDIESSIKHKTYSRQENYWNGIHPTNKLKTIKKDSKKWIPHYYLNRRQKVVIT